MYTVSNTNYLFPEGDLVSVRGEVISLQEIPHPVNFEKLGFLYEQVAGISKSLDIYLQAETLVVNIFGSLRNTALPIELGVGVTATFHRVLSSRFTKGLMLTPVSSIDIHKIKSVNPPTPSQVVIHGRVVALCDLVIEMNVSSSFNIPVASVVFEDGCSSFRCWAENEVAISLLRFREDIAFNGFHEKALFRLRRILLKHRKVAIKNYGSVSDPFQQQFSVSVDSDHKLESSDEYYLKSVAFNACFGHCLTIAGNQMERRCAQFMMRKASTVSETGFNFMPNLHVVSVNNTDSLSRARELIQELDTL